MRKYRISLQLCSITHSVYWSWHVKTSNEECEPLGQTEDMRQSRQVTNSFIHLGLGQFIVKEKLKFIWYEIDILI